jgi:TonB dependent receptor/TonB-dependent Receptor Plug Domain
MKWLAVIVLTARVASAQPAATVHGTIVDRADHKPVSGAVITVGGELAASDDDGRFAVTLRPGSYTIEITAPWLVTLRTPIVLLGPLELTIEVDPAAHVGGEVVEVRDLAPTELGETRVDAKLARSLPGGGDAAKIVQSLPAVARPSAGSTDIVVWGAAPQDTRTFVDGVPVPALYHLGGYRSAIGNDVIGDIKLTPAAFGVDRGRAIGGVIDIAFADPASLPSWRVQADVLDGGVAGRAKLGDLTIAVAIRQSWLDRAVALIENPKQLAPNAPLPRWTDAQIVARMPMHDGLVLSAWVIASLDSLDRELSSDDPATQTDETTDQRMIRGQVTLRHERADGYDSGTIWIGNDHTSDDLQVGLIPADQDTRAWVGGARGVQQSRLGNHATLTFGTDLDGEVASLTRTGSLTIPAREGDIHIFGQPPGDDVAADRWTATTIDGAAHAAIDLRGGPIIATLGVRADGWLLTASRLTPRVGSTPGLGYQSIEFTQDPRASIQYRVSDEAALRIDGGLYHQARAASDVSAVFGTPSLGLEQAWHLTAGGQWHRGPFAIEAAVYARELDDLVARDLAVTPQLAQALTQGGTGDVIGLQVTARVLDYQGVSGWLSYNLSRSRRKDADTQAERFFDHDQTHGLIAVAGWERGPWTLGSRVRYATGEPRTDVIGAFFDSRSGRFQPVLGPHNGVRLPAYFAADLRAERRFPIHSARAAVYVEVQNLTGRANAEEIIYSADFSQKSYLTSLPLLAIAGLRIER